MSCKLFSRAVLMNAPLVVLMTLACAGSQETEPTPVTSPAPAISVTATLPSSTNRMTIPKIGLTFEIPTDWQRQGQDWVWSPVSSTLGTPVGSGGQGIGSTWQEIRPGWEPESILPDNSLMLGKTPGPELSWGTADTYKLQVMVPSGQGQVQAIETHIVVRGTDKLYDFYASARDDEQLNALEPILHQVVTSVVLPE